MHNFKEEVLSAVKKIPAGRVLTYQEIAERAGNPKAWRTVGNILSKNYNPGIPCHRVLGAGGEIGGYNRGLKEKLAKIIKEGAIGVLPTDTIYGLIGSALSRKTVKRIYQVKKRNPKKPLIILINSLEDLKIFGVKTSRRLKKNLLKFWPGKTSILLPCSGKKFFYLHRGTKNLAFRLPAKKELADLVKLTGPLVAPSANPEGEPPAKTVNQAKKYFGKKIDFYVSAGKLPGRPSMLIQIKNGKIIILRK